MLERAILGAYFKLEEFGFVGKYHYWDLPSPFVKVRIVFETCCGWIYVYI
jgi:hypothetical protein